MLQFHDFTITHLKDLQVIVKDLNLVVNQGDKLAIIGEEGTGKSSLIKAIVQPDQLATYAQTQGQVTNHFSQIGYLAQSLTESQLRQTVSDFLYGDLDYDQFDFALFYKMAEQFHLDMERFETHQQTLASLSGGEKLKIQLAKLLAYAPDLLVLDEPSSDLDRKTLEWLEAFIHQTNQTVIFISHDEALLAKTATAILHLELLKKRMEPRASFFKGDYNHYKQERLEQFERQLQLANKERAEHAKKLQRHHRLQQSVEHTLRNTHDSTAGRLLAKKMKVILSQKRRFDKEEERFTEVPQDMDDIHLFFANIHPLPSSKTLINWKEKILPTGQIVDLLVRGQDKIVVTGENGIGKTRLLKEIVAELEHSPTCSIGYMPQNYEELLQADQTALSFLTDLVDAETGRTFLANLRFTREEINHSTSNLSGGQKAKLFLAKMVLAQNNVLVLDEPTRHFSPTSQPLVRQILQDFPGAIISVSHDRLFIEEVGKTVYQLTETGLDKQY